MTVKRKVMTTATDSLNAKPVLEFNSVPTILKHYLYVLLGSVQMVGRDGTISDILTSDLSPITTSPLISAVAAT